MMAIRSLSLLATIAWAESAQQGLRTSEERLLEDLGSEQNFGFQSRIVGGTIANAKNYEFSVNLGGCGGSLIYEDIVLTAAHCQPLYPEVARIGGSNQNNGLPKEIVGWGSPHPMYDEITQAYDFMIYKLASPVLNYKPVTLNTDTSSPSGTETLTVIGFGSTYEGGPGSFELREVDVQHTSHETCNQNYLDQIDDAIMFCAGVSEGGKDSCQGDSGGPILDSNGVQVGVTSFGNGCAQKGFPGVYARVTAVLPWIQESICSLSSNPPAACPSGSGSSNNSENTNGNDDSNNNQGSGNDNGNENPNVHLIQPKGITLRIEINYDQYPSENAWVLYNEETKEELHWSNYGDVELPGVSRTTFTELPKGTYTFLLFDNFNDGICCDHGLGYIKVFEVYPPELGGGESLVWRHNGQFENAAGASFLVDDEARAMGVPHVKADTIVDFSSSPYFQHLP